MSRHSTEKGIDILIKSIEKIPNALLENVKFILAGDGGEHEALKDLSAKLNIADKVIFLGDITDVSGWYSAADLFVAPSRQESFGLSIAEAMACQCCVVATRVGGIPEVVGDAGLLVDSENVKQLADAVIYLVKNNSARMALAKKGEKRVKENFTVQHNRERLYNLIMSGP